MVVIHPVSWTMTNIIYQIIGIIIAGTRPIFYTVLDIIYVAAGITSKITEKTYTILYRKKMPILSWESRMSTFQKIVWLSLRVCTHFFSLEFLDGSHWFITIMWKNLNFIDTVKIYFEFPYKSRNKCFKNDVCWYVCVVSICKCVMCNMYRVLHYKIIIQIR